MSADEDERICAFDVSCCCGAEAKGFWSTAEAEDWQETRDHEVIEEVTP